MLGGWADGAGGAGGLNEMKEKWILVMVLVDDPREEALNSIYDNKKGMLKIEWNESFSFVIIIQYFMWHIIHPLAVLYECNRKFLLTSSAILLPPTQHWLSCFYYIIIFLYIFTHFASLCYWYTTNHGTLSGIRGTGNYHNIFYNRNWKSKEENFTDDAYQIIINNVYFSVKSSKLSGIK